MKIVTIRVPVYMRPGERQMHEVPVNRVAPSGLLAITTIRHKVYDVTHVPTGLRVPAPAPSAYGRGSGYTSGGFDKLSDAKAFMLALDAAQILPDRAPDKAEIRVIRDWVEAYTVEASA